MMAGELVGGNGVSILSRRVTVLEMPLILAYERDSAKRDARYARFHPNPAYARVDSQFEEFLFCQS